MRINNMTKITFGTIQEKALRRYEIERTEWMETQRKTAYLERRLLNKLYLRHTSKKAHLIVKVVKPPIDWDKTSAHAVITRGAVLWRS